MIKYIINIFLIILVALPLDAQHENDKITYTILYDNTSSNDSIIADHGFSCLLESEDFSCVFDVGRISDKFMKNADRLNIDFSKTDYMVISHFHGDHMGGLFDVLARCNKPTLYLPFSYPCTSAEPHTAKSDSDFTSMLNNLKPLVSDIIMKKEPVNIGKRIYTSGMIDDQSYEQALIIPTSKGLIIITGCAHPGILDIVKRASAAMKQDIWFVMGGFHLLRTDTSEVKAIAEELRHITKYIGPCHCTGKHAEDILKTIFKDDYVDLQAGMILRLKGGALTCNTI